MSLRVFLTGATGYIGGRLAERLVADGHRVVALVRPASVREGKARRLEELGAVTSEGDITDRYSLRPGMSGADWVIHAAADLDMNGPPERMRQINVEGTANVASLAYKLGVGRFLSVSSVARWGGSPPDGSLADETSTLYQPPSLYSATKADAERAVQEWVDKGLKANTIFPSLVYGPPGKRSGTNALLGLIVRKKVPFLVGGDRRLSWIHLDDLVVGILRLMERAEPGEDYLLAGEAATLREVAHRACTLAGVRPPRIDVPLPLARALFAIARGLGRLPGLSVSVPRVGADQLRSLGRHWAFDDSRAREALDWQPRSLQEGLPETVEMLTRGSQIPLQPPL